MIDRCDLMPRKQFREQAHHHLAVFQHVGHAGRYPQIVFQYVELTFAGTHDVDSGDMGVDVGGDIDILHLGPVLRVLQNLLGWNDARLDDFLPVVNIVDEHVQRFDALHQSCFELAPFGGMNDARNNVEWNQPFSAGVIAVDREGNADSTEDQVGFCALAGNRFSRLGRQPGRKFTIMFADGNSVTGVHLVKKVCHKFASFRVRLRRKFLIYAGVDLLIFTGLTSSAQSSSSLVVVMTDYHANSIFGQKKLRVGSGCNDVSEVGWQWMTVRANDKLLSVHAHGVGAGTAAGAGMSMVVKSAGLAISRYSMSGE